MEQKKLKKGATYYGMMVLHWVFILGWFSSPWWLPWPLIVIVSLLYYLQNKVLGYCILTRWQFRLSHTAAKSEISFWEVYLKKLGINVSRKKITEWGRVVPLILIGLALVLQKAF